MDSGEKFQSHLDLDRTMPNVELVQSIFLCYLESMFHVDFKKLINV